MTIHNTNYQLRSPIQSTSPMDIDGLSCQLGSISFASGQRSVSKSTSNDRKRRIQTSNPFSVVPEKKVLLDSSAKKASALPVSTTTKRHANELPGAPAKRRKTEDSAIGCASLASPQVVSPQTAKPKTQTNHSNYMAIRRQAVFTRKTQATNGETMFIFNHNGQRDQAILQEQEEGRIELAKKDLRVGLTKEQVAQKTEDSKAKWLAARSKHEEKQPIIKATPKKQEKKSTRTKSSIAKWIKAKKEQPKTHSKIGFLSGSNFNITVNKNETREGLFTKIQNNPRGIIVQ